MPNLTQQQLTNLNTGALSRDGEAVPNTGNGNRIYQAACWSWALFGEYVNVNDEHSAYSIYQNMFTRNAQQQPTALNNGLLDGLFEIYPQIAAFRTALRDNTVNAIGGNAGAQAACRTALMKIAATVAGLTVVADDNASVYQIHMRTDTWHSWHHWSIGIRRADGTVNHVQKVNDTPVRCRCNTSWDEHMGETVIRVDGLLQTHIGIFNNIQAGAVAPV